VAGAECCGWKCSFVEPSEVGILYNTTGTWWYPKMPRNHRVPTHSFIRTARACVYPASKDSPPFSPLRMETILTPSYPPTPRRDRPQRIREAGKGCFLPATASEQRDCRHGMLLYLNHLASVFQQSIPLHFHPPSPNSIFGGSVSTALDCLGYSVFLPFDKCREQAIH
jgi:hypothetical protein